MSCSIINFDDLVLQQAQIFDDMRSGAAFCYLIKRDVHTKRFVSVILLEAGWFVSWDKFRDSFVLRVATSDPNFADKIAQSSFLAYGIADAQSEIDVYKISTDARDKVPPNESSPCWKVFVERIENERFGIPEDEA